MKKKIIDILRYFVLPIAFSIGLIFTEMTVGGFITSNVFFALIFLLGAAFTLALILISRSFTPCAFLALAGMVLPLYSLVYCLTHPNMFMNDQMVILTAANWAAVMGTCVLLKFFLKTEKITGFARFFKAGSIIFIPIYLFAIGFSMFFDSYRIFTMQYQIRRINFIPFVKTILPYITGSAHVNDNISIINLLSNVLFFLPVGFYLGVFSGKIKTRLRIVLLIGFPALIEALQFIFACGTCDIDDVIVNSIGGALGLLVWWGVEKAYGSYQKKPGARLFAIK